MTLPSPARWPPADTTVQPTTRKDRLALGAGVVSLATLWVAAGLGAPPWAQAALALGVCIGAWDVLRRGALDLCVDLRSSGDGLAVLSSACGLGVSVVLTALHIWPNAGAPAALPPLLYAASASVLVGRHLLRSQDLGTRDPGPRSNDATTSHGDVRATPLSGARRWAFLLLSICAAAGAFWMHATGTPAVYAIGVAVTAAFAAAAFDALRLSAVGGNTNDFETALAATSVVLFQRTGVLTRAQPEVTHVIPLIQGVDEAKIVHLASVAEYGIQHPVREAVLESPYSRAQTIPGVQSRQLLAARGVVADLQGRRLIFGNLRLLDDEGWDHHELERLNEATREHWEAGETVLYVGLEGKALGAIALQDPMVEGLEELVAPLRELRVERGVITGDVLQSTAVLAGKLDACHLQAGLSPQEEREQLAHLCSHGKVVATVSRLSPEEPSLEVTIYSHADEAAAPDVDLVEVHGTVASLDEVPERLAQAKRARAGARRRRVALWLHHVLGVPLFCGALLPWTGVAPQPALAALATTAVGWVALRHASRCATTA